MSQITFRVNRCFADRSIQRPKQGFSLEEERPVFFSYRNSLSCFSLQNSSRHTEPYSALLRWQLGNFNVQILQLAIIHRSRCSGEHVRSLLSFRERDDVTNVFITR